MEKAKKISKETTATRLFSKDSDHIKKLVRKNRFTDKRFENNSAAIRYYVELGIAAENSAEYPVKNTDKNLDREIINSEQEDVVREDLIPLTNTVENLFGAIKILGANQAEYFTNSATQLSRIETHLERGIKEISRQLITSLESIYAQFDQSEKTGNETLRNLIVLRSVFYIFLLGHKTGKIEPGRENIGKWNQVIKLAHEKANGLSIKEVKMLSSAVLEANTIQSMAAEIFRQVNALPEPKTE